MDYQFVTNFSFIFILWDGIAEWFYSGFDLIVIVLEFCPSSIDLRWPSKIFSNFLFGLRQIGRILQIPILIWIGKRRIVDTLVEGDPGLSVWSFGSSSDLLMLQYAGWSLFPRR